MTDGIPYGSRLTELADRLGDETAVVFVATDGREEHISWRALDERANQTARLLAERGLGQDGLLVIAFPNCLEHVYITFGAWKVGASVLGLRGDLPAWERERVLPLANPTLIAADWDDVDGVVTLADVRSSVALDGSPLDSVGIPPTTGLAATSGSTGTPKIIVRTVPGIYFDDDGSLTTAAAGNAMGVTYLVVSPLYHNNGALLCCPMLLRENRVVLMERFDAAQAVDLIERHRVNQSLMVPTMLQRIARLDGIGDRDLSSLERVIYCSASLPEWAARAWLELIPPDRFIFAYGGSEQIGQAMCSGVEWLEHPGTSGLPSECEMLILDADRRPLPPGEVGDIYLRLLRPEQPFEYVGVPTPEPILDGYRTYGDMGYLDDDGFLYVVDRRHDLIISGGANIFPAEVEAALSEHADLVDAVVIGMPDPDWGQRVHAIVQPRDPGNPPSDDELRDHCRALLAGYKVPKGFELIDEMPRTTAGKVNRSRLITERVPTA